MAECPTCKSRVNEGAKVCPNCGEWLGKGMKDPRGPGHSVREAENEQVATAIAYFIGAVFIAFIAGLFVAIGLSILAVLFSPGIVFASMIAKTAEFSVAGYIFTSLAIGALFILVLYLLEHAGKIDKNVGYLIYVVVVLLSCWICYQSFKNQSYPAVAGEILTFINDAITKLYSSTIGMFFE